MKTSKRMPERIPAFIWGCIMRHAMNALMINCQENWKDLSVTVNYLLEREEPVKKYMRQKGFIEPEECEDFVLQVIKFSLSPSTSRSLFKRLGDESEETIRVRAARG